MNRKAVAAGALVALALALGVPYGIGLRVEADFRAALAAAPRHAPYPATLVRYDRGLFGASAETRFELEPGVFLGLHHAISHGPRLDGLRTARIVSTLDTRPDWLAWLRQVYGSTDPLTVTVDVGWPGDFAIAVRSPAIAPGEANGGLRWQGLDGRFAVDGDRVHGRADAPGLDLGDRGALGALALGLDTRVIADGVWTGTASASLASLRAAGPQGLLSITGLHLESDSREHDGQLRSAFSVAARAIEVDGSGISDARLRAVLDGVGVPALSQLSAALNRDGAAGPAIDDPEAAQHLLAAVRPALGAIAAGQPSFAVEELSFAAPQGKVDASARVRYVGDAAIDDFSPLGDLAVAGKFEMPLALLELLVGAQAEVASSARGLDGEMLRPSPEQLAAHVRTTLAGLIAQGLLQVDGERARSELDYKPGALSINGQALAAPPI